MSHIHDVAVLGDQTKTLRNKLEAVVDAKQTTELVVGEGCNTVTEGDGCGLVHWRDKHSPAANACVVCINLDAHLDCSRVLS